MKKVCFFISSIAQPGGTGRVCTIIANKLCELGYQVTILSMYGNNPFFELRPGVKIIGLYKKKYRFKYFLPLVLLNLRAKIKAINPDILVNVDSALFVYSHAAGRGLHFKNIAWEHFNFNVSLGSKVRVISRQLAARYSDCVITLTKKDKTNWEHKLKCTAPIITINNPSPFNSTNVNLQNRKHLVIAAGRLTYQKGFDRLLNAWQLFKTSDGFGWQLHIVGSGEMEHELEEQIAVLNLGSSAKIISATTHIEEHYNEASIYCMTSRFEGYPMVLLEAQSFGLPLVSYDCQTGPAEIINNENGILIKDGDAKGLADALLYLTKNEDKRLSLAKKSFENSFNYSADIIIGSWINLFENDLNLNSL